MKVSIIIPCYNYGRYLDECFSNLQGQSHPDWEAIVVDDGSTDQTREIVDAWRSKEQRIRYFRQENSGVSAARNLGLKKASGELIQFLDADDLLSPEKIRLQADYFLRHPEVDLCYTENHYFADGAPDLRFPDQECLGREWMIRFSGRGAFAIEQLIRNNLAVVSSPMLRKSLVDYAGFFPEKLRHNEDWQYWLQCALAGANIHFLPEPEAYTLIRVHSGSVSQQVQTMRYGELTLRSWIREQLSEAASLQEPEKAALHRLNEERKRQIFKQIMYHGPLADLAHLSRLATVYDWPTVLAFYLKALNFRRKSNPSLHAGNRHHHPVQRQDA